MIYVILFIDFSPGICVNFFKVMKQGLILSKVCPDFCDVSRFCRDRSRHWIPFLSGCLLLFHFHRYCKPVEGVGCRCYKQLGVVEEEEDCHIRNKQSDIGMVHYRILVHWVIQKHIENMYIVGYGIGHLLIHKSQNTHSKQSRESNHSSYLRCKVVARLKGLDIDRLHIECCRYEFQSGIHFRKMLSKETKIPRRSIEEVEGLPVVVEDCCLDRCCIFWLAGLLSRQLDWKFLKNKK